MLRSSRRSLLPSAVLMMVSTMALSQSAAPTGSGTPGEAQPGVQSRPGGGAGPTPTGSGHSGNAASSPSGIGGPAASSGTGQNSSAGAGVSGSSSAGSGNAPR